ncbi:MAG: bifunctional D-glycero-beta-D-manno-heptose-7-phosphate kinase/D-glycero-beta-D-manno-heptose 1-phosphate adenylyltransferase HldE [Magnetococcales bacterium]|nr:bifunctional D-glycero-beta-D-manno-heptose-7-phosphate kinase/D-glycero-beta-D-manno-heptose 1-phosphate adenylyltransferase HldE [Magnetococcales bacterium]
MFDNRDQILRTLTTGFDRHGILVVGDLMLDRYLWGQVQRISPEAPVPVVRLTRESDGVGGAANVAMNLARLGLRPRMAGLVGQDKNGQRIRQALEQAGVDAHLVMVVEGWPTITKTRVIGGHQQMLRLDREEPLVAAGAIQDALLAAILAQLDGQDPPRVVILSDYAKGLLTAPFCRAVIAHARARGIPILVDPKGKAYDKYRGVTALSPNRSELGAAVGMETDNLEPLLAAGEQLRQRLEVAFFAVTLSESGIALLEADTAPRRIPATAREVFDVSGAGDTVIATLAAGLAAGLSRLDALHLANLAAGVVVGKVGTTPINLDELQGVVVGGADREQAEKCLTLEQAVTLTTAWRSRGERIVFTNGCFDLLHVGHVTYLEKAHRLGQRLIVGLNTDRSVRTLKGPQRPLIREEERARVLAALAVVDAVVLFDETTPLRLIRALQPDILAKGADYTEENVVGAREVRAWGGSVALVPLVEGISTSRIVAGMRTGPEQTAASGE